MTLEELDKILENTGLDLSNPVDMNARNQVLELHGRTVLESRDQRCSNCWYKENNRCSSSCKMYNLPEDPVEASKRYLSTQNNIHQFPFFVQYIVPVYEKLTGKKDVLKKIYDLAMENE